MSRLTIIVAATKSNGIGVNGSLPWRLPKELKYFSEATTSTGIAGERSNAEDSPNVVIMGRKSWESIPPKRRPLPRRFNAVISRDPAYDLGTKSSNVVLKDSLKSAFALLPSPPSSSLISAPAQPRAFIIGGATLYTESLALPPSPTEPYVDRILLTRINEPAFVCDVFMPDFTRAGAEGGEAGWRRETHEKLRGWVGFDVPEGEQEENGVKYEFQMWVRD